MHWTDVDRAGRFNDSDPLSFAGVRVSRRLRLESLAAALATESIFASLKRIPVRRIDIHLHAANGIDRFACDRHHRIVPMIPDVFAHASLRIRLRR